MNKGHTWEENIHTHIQFLSSLLYLPKVPLREELCLIVKYALLHDSTPNTRTRPIKTSSLIHAQQDQYYQKMQKVSGGKHVKKLKSLCTVGRYIKWYNHFEIYCDCSSKKKKLNIDLPYDPAISLLSIYSKQLKIGLRGISVYLCSQQH